jgi:hypothetical protein
MDCRGHAGLRRERPILGLPAAGDAARLRSHGVHWLARGPRPDDDESVVGLARLVEGSEEEPAADAAAAA